MNSGVVSVDETTDGAVSQSGWVGRLGCSTAAKTTRIGTNPRDSYDGGRDAASVSRVRVVDGLVISKVGIGDGTIGGVCRIENVVARARRAADFHQPQWTPRTGR